MSIRSFATICEAVSRCRDGWQRHGTYAGQGEAGAQALALRAAGWQTRMSSVWGRVTVWKRK